MCRASCKKTYKCVTRQQRMGEQSRLSTWPDVNVLIASCRLRPGLASGLVPSGFHTKTQYAFLCFPIPATCLVHLILHLITLIGFGDETELTKLFITQCSSLALSFLPYRLTILTLSVDSANCRVEQITELDFVTLVFFLL
jgi:hypothetical protein